MVTITILTYNIYIYTHTCIVQCNCFESRNSGSQTSRNFEVYEWSRHAGYMQICFLLILLLNCCGSKQVWLWVLIYVGWFVPDDKFIIIVIIVISIINMKLEAPSKWIVWVIAYVYIVVSKCVSSALVLEPNHRIFARTEEWLEPTATLALRLNALILGFLGLGPRQGSWGEGPWRRWLKKQRDIWFYDTVDGSEIRHPPVEVGSLSHYL